MGKNGFGFASDFSYSSSAWHLEKQENKIEEKEKPEKKAEWKEKPTAREKERERRREGKKEGNTEIIPFAELLVGLSTNFGFDIRIETERWKQHAITQKVECINNPIR